MPTWIASGRRRRLHAEAVQPGAEHARHDPAGHVRPGDDRHDQAGLHLRQPPGITAHDWLATCRDNITWTRGKHTVKVGGYFEYMQNNEARGGNWMGEFKFSNTQQPARHQLRVLQRHARRVLAVHRNRQVPADPQPAMVVGVVRAGHVAAQRAVDARLRRALPLYSPYCRLDDQVANFDPSKYDPRKAPRLYCRRSSTGRASRSIRRRARRSTRSHRRLRAGHGRSRKRHGAAGDAGVPRGFREIAAADRAAARASRGT